MTERQMPKPAEIFELLQFKKPELNAKRRRLDAALTIEDLRAIARRRTPRGAFDYTDGAAEGEVSIARARQAFEDIEFHPSILKDVSTVDTSVTVFGGPSALPFGIAPTGFTRLMHTEGEVGGRRGGGSGGHPVLPVHPGHHLDRAGQGGQPERAQLVPAVRDAGPGDLLRPGPPGGRRRVRHPVLHRGRPHRRAPGCATGATGSRSRRRSPRARCSTRSRAPGGGGTS